jgi:hypothetical protein
MQLSIDWRGWMQAWRSPPALAAAMVNLAPLLGVVFWGWGVGALVVLYWLENLVIGLFNAAKMIVVGVAMGPVWAATLLFFLPFFVFHFGVFCLAHGAFVTAMFHPAGVADADLSVFDTLDPRPMIERATAAAPHLGLVLAALAAMRAASFFLFFIGRGAFRRTNIVTQMGAPYGRIVLLHLAIFAGGFGVAMAGEPAWGVLLLVLGKTVFEVWAHWREARAPLKPESAPPPAG